MPEPQFRIACHACRTELDSGDTPPANAQAVLTAFADASCPRGGGLDCPNATATREELEEQRPGRLRQLVAAIRVRAPRAARLVLPALTANTPTDVPVTWAPDMPDATYSVVATPVLPAALVGVVRVAVKPGSLTKAGCVLTVVATEAVAAGQGGLHVVAVP